MKQPSLAEFTVFVRGVMGIPTGVLPDDSQSLKFALAVAMAIVNPALKKVPIPKYDAENVQLTSGTSSIYVLAVYNLGGDNLINFAQDAPDAPPVSGSSPPLPYFAYTRKTLNINGYVSGTISGSNDESTGQTLVVPDAVKAYTLANLQQSKTPWGRQYIALAQSYGPYTWGIS